MLNIAKEVLANINYISIKKKTIKVYLRRKAIPAGLKGVVRHKCFGLKLEVRTYCSTSQEIHNSIH